MHDVAVAWEDGAQGKKVLGSVDGVGSFASTSTENERRSTTLSLPNTQNVSPYFGNPSAPSFELQQSCDSEMSKVPQAPAKKSKKGWASFLKLPKPGKSRKRSTVQESKVAQHQSSDVVSVVSSQVSASRASCSAPSRQLSGATVWDDRRSDTSALSVAETTKKSKSMFSKLLGSRSKKKKQVMSGASSVSHHETPTLEDVPVPARCVVPESPEEELSRLRSETKEALLHVLSQFQQSYFGYRQHWGTASVLPMEKGSLCSDEVHLTFTLEKLRALVDSLFDKQRFSTVVRELGEADDRLAETWVAKTGLLTQGRSILKALTDRVEVLEHEHKAQVYYQVEQLTGEINALRERIRDAAEEGFGLLDSSTETGIVLPRCLVDSVCLTTSSLRDAPARMDRATALDQAVSRILHQKHFRRPVSEGFALVSERSDLERLEQKLDGRWGSYGLFERWLQDSVRWQWLDMFARRQFLSANAETDRFMKDKKTQFYTFLDQRLAQLWLGRLAALRRENLTRLNSSLYDALQLSQSTPAIQKGLYVVERALMEAEDYRSHFDRLLLNPNVRARVAEELATPAAKAYDVLVTPQAVERLIQSASRLRFNLMKNAGLGETLSVRATYDVMKRDITRLEMEHRTFEKEHGSRMAALQKEELTLKEKKKSIAEKMQTELKKKEKQETLKRLVEQEQNSVASLEATYKSMLKENADREKEYSALKAARKAAQLRAVRLQKHVKEEEKKHKELLQRIKKQQEPTVSVTSKGPTVGRLLKNMFSTTKSVKSQGSILSVESGSVASSKVLSDEPDVSDAYNEPVSPHENRQDIGTATRSSISEDVERLGLSPDKKRRPVLNRIGHAMHLTGSKRGYASEKPREKKTDVLDDRGKAAIVARDDGSVSGGRADQDLPKLDANTTITTPFILRKNSLSTVVLSPRSSEASFVSSVTSSPKHSAEPFVPLWPGSPVTDPGVVFAGVSSGSETRSLSGFDPLVASTKKKKKKSWFQQLLMKPKKKKEDADDGSSVLSLPPRSVSSNLDAGVKVPTLSSQRQYSLQESRSEQPPILHNTAETEVTPDAPVVVVVAEAIQSRGTQNQNSSYASTFERQSRLDTKFQNNRCDLKRLPDAESVGSIDDHYSEVSYVSSSENAVIPEAQNRYRVPQPVEDILLVDDLPIQTTSRFRATASVEDTHKNDSAETDVSADDPKVSFLSDIHDANSLDASHGGKTEIALPLYSPHFGSVEPVVTNRSLSEALALMVQRPAPTPVEPPPSAPETPDFFKRRTQSFTEDTGTFSPVTINIIPALSSASLQSQLSSTALSSNTDVLDLQQSPKPEAEPTSTVQLAQERQQATMPSRLPMTSSETFSYVPWADRAPRLNAAKGASECASERLLFTALLSTVLTPDDLGRVSSVLATVQLKSSTELFSPGDTVTTLYIVVEGKIQILTNDKSLIEVLSPGSLVLDREFVHKARCSVYAVSTGRVVLQKITRASFDRIVLEARQRVQAQVIDALQGQNSPFRDLTHHEASLLLQQLQIEYYAYKDIIRLSGSGDDTGGLYLLLYGECREQREKTSEAQHRRALLYTSGEFFGLQGLQGQPYTITLQARGLQGASMARIPLQLIFAEIPDIKNTPFGGSSFRNADALTDDSAPSEPQGSIERRFSGISKKSSSLLRQRKMKVNANIRRLFGKKNKSRKKNERSLTASSESSAEKRDGSGMTSAPT